VDGNNPVVTHPIPGVPTATATTTLNAQFMPESVVVKSGANTYEFTYSDYKDWNNPLNPAEALYLEDPDSFVEPWVMPTRILRPAGGDAAIIAERAHCEAYEQGDVITNQLRH
jgi:hypothetical protein